VWRATRAKSSLSRASQLIRGVMNRTQIRDVGRQLQFSSITGELMNRSSVGVATTSTARPPRILQASVRMSF